MENEQQRSRKCCSSATWTHLCLSQSSRAKLVSVFAVAPGRSQVALSLSLMLEFFGFDGVNLVDVVGVVKRWCNEIGVQQF